MGTSRSSTGPGPGVPLVPPWVPDIPTPLEEGIEENPIADQWDDPETAVPIPQAILSPTARFGPARRRIGRFATEGGRSDMQRGLGHYVRRGYGGSGTATQRMGGTVRTASKLYGALSFGTEGQLVESDSQIDFSGLSGKSADEIMDAIVETVRPMDGTLDSEATRVGIRDALSDLLEVFPAANLLTLSDEQRVFAVERYIALDVYNLFRLDIGKTIQERAPTARDALSRLKDVKDYITETVASRFRALRNIGQRLTGSNILNLARQALQQTFEVFEEYVT